MDVIVDQVPGLDLRKAMVAAMAAAVEVRARPPRGEATTCPRCRRVTGGILGNLGADAGRGVERAGGDARGAQALAPR